MNDISPNSLSSALSRTLPGVTPAESRQSAASLGPATPARTDQVELSDRARLLSQLRETPEIRSELVDRVRAEIADGTYLTADKLDRAADNFINDLDLFG